GGITSAGDPPKASARRRGPMASPARSLCSSASPRRRNSSAAAMPSCAYWITMRNTSSACSTSPRWTHALPRRPSPLAMSPRASAVSSWPSGVRRKIASGAGRAPRGGGPAPEELDDLVPLAAQARGLGLGDLRQIDRAPAAAGRAIELLADDGPQAEPEGVEVVGLLDAVVLQGDLGRGAGAKQELS